jgi:isopentenyl diphosphate isomerase/L-lactate dehydrogenase-like FMN-dependent dehydrogenase
MITSMEERRTSTHWGIISQHMEEFCTNLILPLYLKSSLTWRIWTWKFSRCASCRLRPRVLVDVSNINMSTSLLGYDMPSPIIVAPTGGHKLANPEGLKHKPYNFRMLKYGI